MALRSLSRFFKENFGVDASQDPDDRQHRLKVATATILLEIAYADDSFSLTEEKNVIDFLKTHFGVTDEMAHDLLEAAEQMRGRTIDHWNLTNQIRTNTSLEERIDIVKEMWRLVYSDGHLHQYENYLVRKIADLLGLEHHVMIEAKLAVREES